MLACPEMQPSPAVLRDAGRPVLAVASNKGGVGKTTIAANLAIYLRALHEELPILLISLDDQATIDRMFAVGTSPRAPNLTHAWVDRSLDRVIRLGEFGVHYTPSAPDLPALKGRARHPSSLRWILAQSSWRGLVVLDTKSDFEALTQTALVAADRTLVPVADWASLREAERAREVETRLGQRPRGRIVLSLVDRRSKDQAGATLAEALARAIAGRQLPRYQSSLSRSPRVELLNSASPGPRSILHHARGTAVHREFRDLAREVSRDLGLAQWTPRHSPNAGRRALRASPASPWDPWLDLFFGARANARRS